MMGHGNVDSLRGSQAGVRISLVAFVWGRFVLQASYMMTASWYCRLVMVELQDYGDPWLVMVISLSCFCFTSIMLTNQLQDYGDQ